MDQKLQEYVDFIKSTWLPGVSAKDELLRAGLGVVGEAGEVAEKLKKLLRGDFDSGGTDPVHSTEFEDSLLLELGDVLYYLCTLCRLMGFSIQDMMAVNIEKLASRQQRGKLQGDGDTR